MEACASPEGETVPVPTEKGGWMMRKLNLLLIVVFCVALLPAMAMAGNGNTGACFVVGDQPVWPSSGTEAPDGKFNLAGCADGFTLEECSSVDELVEFWEGATCEDVADKGEIDWDGSCEASIAPVGTTCIQLWTGIGGAATEALCINDIGGTWFDDLECGGVPVPTMPPVGLAALMLLLLAGALLFLTKKASSPAV